MATLEIESSIEPDIAAMTDRELLEEIYRTLFRTETKIAEAVEYVQPTLDGLSKSPIGKMLGIK